MCLLFALFADREVRFVGWWLGAGDKITGALPHISSNWIELTPSIFKLFSSKFRNRVSIVFLFLIS